MEIHTQVTRTHPDREWCSLSLPQPAVQSGWRVSKRSLPKPDSGDKTKGTLFLTWPVSSPPRPAAFLLDRNYQPQTGAAMLKVILDVLQNELGYEAERSITKPQNAAP